MYVLFVYWFKKRKKRKTQTYTQTQRQRGTCPKSHESGPSFDYRASIWAPLGTEAWLWRGKPVASPSAPGTGHKAEGTDVPAATLHALLGSGCCCSSVDLMKPLSRTGECFSFSHFLIIFGYGARVILSIFFFLDKCFLMTTNNEVSSRFVVLNKGSLCLFEDICQCQETLLDATGEGRGCCWHLVGGGQGWSLIRVLQSQASPHSEGLSFSNCQQCWGWEARMQTTLLLGCPSTLSKK